MKRGGIGIPYEEYTQRFAACDGEAGFYIMHGMLSQAMESTQLPPLVPKHAVFRKGTAGGTVYR